MLPDHSDQRASAQRPGPGRRRRTLNAAAGANSRVSTRRSRLRRSTAVSAATPASRPSTSHTARTKASAGVPSSSCAAQGPGRSARSAAARCGRPSARHCVLYLEACVETKNRLRNVVQVVQSRIFHGLSHVEARARGVVAARRRRHPAPHAGGRAPRTGASRPGRGSGARAGRRAGRPSS